MIEEKVKKYVASCFKDELEQNFQISPELFLDNV